MHQVVLRLTGLRAGVLDHLYEFIEVQSRLPAGELLKLVRGPRLFCLLAVLARAFCRERVGGVQLLGRLPLGHLPVAVDGAAHLGVGGLENILLLDSFGLEHGRF